VFSLDLSGLGFKTEPNDTGRPAYHPSTMLKNYVYGYLNRVQSSRCLQQIDESIEMSLHVLAYNMKRMMNILGTKPLIEAIGASDAV